MGNRSVAEHPGSALEVQPPAFDNVVDVEARLLRPADPRPSVQWSPFRSYRLSWLACGQDFGRFLIRSLVCFVLMAALKSFPLFVALFSASTIWLVLRVAEVRSVRLFTNEQGVWVQRGLWPWNKGLFGMKWRDISEARFNQNFTSWMTKAYAVRIGHRFTNAQEIQLGNVRNGHEAAVHINQLLANVAGHLQ